MKYLWGCLGGFIALAVGIALIQMIFNNVVGIIGLAIIIWAIYQWRINRKLNAKSKAPIIFIAVGLLITSIGFATKAEEKAQIAEEQAAEEEKKRLEEEQAAEEEKKKEEARKAAEAEEKAKEEAEKKRVAEEKAKEEEAKRLEEEKKAEELARAEQQKTEEEQKKEAAAASNEPEYFQNCKELRKKYPSGVASDHPAYQSKMDRDKDGWACEK